MMFTSPEDFLDKLNQWFNGFIAFPLLAIAYGYLEIFSGGLEGLIVLDDTISYIVIALALVYAIIVTRRYKNQIRAISNDENLMIRLTAYFRISKLFFLKIFLVSLLPVFGLYLTGSIAFAGFYAFLLFLLSIYRPSLLNVANKLGLKGDVRKDFLKKSSFTIN